ncbi:MAG: o-succinylbenzoate synthase [Prevotella sp.]|nr:o-succinylbenzoate synthase [Prevotella sp.]
MKRYLISISERVFHFKQPAGTSRGVYLTRKSWFVHIRYADSLPDLEGIGECAPLPNLSCDDIPDYEEVLRKFCDYVEDMGFIPNKDMADYPSMIFGLETALQHLHQQRKMTEETGDDLLSPYQIFHTRFSRGQCGVPINGLVWMGNYEEMAQRMEEKIAAHFHCVKLKIGAIDFDKELDLIRRIRKRFTKEQIEIRVDANGAFSPEEAMDKLHQLAEYDLHSIEQPIRQGQWEEMARLCEHTPLPIALDEELIGVNTEDEKIRLLDTIKPQYIILKPSLHGGMYGTSGWLQLSKKRGISCWITSALESNIGLNAIAQYTVRMYELFGYLSLADGSMRPQGLGTGQLFTDNIPVPLEIRGDQLWFNPK